MNHKTICVDLKRLCVDTCKIEAKSFNNAVHVLTYKSYVSAYRLYVSAWKLDVSTHTEAFKKMQKCRIYVLTHEKQWLTTLIMQCVCWHINRMCRCIGFMCQPEISMCRHINSAFLHFIKCFNMCRHIWFMHRHMYLNIIAFRISTSKHRHMCRYIRFMCQHMYYIIKDFSYYFTCFDTYYFVGHFFIQKIPSFT